MGVDVHQHLWPPSFVAALRARTRPPRLDGWTLHLDGEPPYQVDPRDHDVELRVARNAGLKIALVSLSSPLGIEHLPPAEAWPLIDAFHAGAAELPSPFRAWAAAAVTDIDPARLARTLDAGFAGLQLPATAVADQAGLANVAPLLDELTARDLPLFIHPGPAAAATHDLPAWWPAVVPYVQQMHASWYAFQAFGRPRHPDLRVCFSLLAGLAPLHSERQIARGGGRGLLDLGAYVETSSYGPRAIDAIIRELGIDMVVHGSDLPYAEPAPLDFGDAARHAIQVANPSRLLYGKESSS